MFSPPLFAGANKFDPKLLPQRIVLPLHVMFRDCAPLTICLPLLGLLILRSC